MPPIPHCNVVRDAREQAAFCQTEERSCNQQPGVVLYDTHKCGAQAPGDHDDRDPDTRSQPLHGHVAGYLGGDVEREEDSERIVVLETGLIHAQIFFQGVETCIPDVCAVEEREEIEKREEGDEAPVNLANQSSGCRLVKLDGFISVFDILLGGLFIYAAARCVDIFRLDFPHGENLCHQDAAEPRIDDYSALAGLLS